MPEGARAEEEVICSVLSNSGCGTSDVDVADNRAGRVGYGSQSQPTFLRGIRLTRSTQVLHMSVSAERIARVDLASNHPRRDWVAVGKTGPYLQQR